MWNRAIIESTSNLEHVKKIVFLFQINFELNQSDAIYIQDRKMLLFSPELRLLLLQPLFVSVCHASKWNYYMEMFLQTHSESLINTWFFYKKSVFFSPNLFDSIDSIGSSICSVLFCSLRHCLQRPDSVHALPFAILHLNISQLNFNLKLNFHYTNANQKEEKLIMNTTRTQMN